MAILKGSPKLTGKFGNSVIKEWNGTRYVASMPSSYKKPTDKDSLKRNDDFLFSTKLASALRKMASIVQLWERLRKGNPAYQTILSENKLLIGNGTDRSIIRMVPEESMNLSLVIKEIITGENTISITINPLKERVDIVAVNDPTILGNILLCGVNPSSKKDKYMVIPVISEYKLVKVDEELNFLFHIGSIQIDEFNQFEEQNIYLTFITLGRNGEPSGSSQLFSWTLEK